MPVRTRGGATWRCSRRADPAVTQLITIGYSPVAAQRVFRCVAAAQIGALHLPISLFPEELRRRSIAPKRAVYPWRGGADGAALSAAPAIALRRDS